MTISCCTALYFQTTGYLFIVSFHLNFRKGLAEKNYFYEWKHGGTEMLNMLPMITHLSWKVEKVGFGYTDQLPKPMFITISLENGTSLILDSKQLRKKNLPKMSAAHWILLPSLPLSSWQNRPKLYYEGVQSWFLLPGLPILWMSSPLCVECL